MKRFYALLTILITYLMLEAVNQYPLDTAYHNWENLGDTLLTYHQQNRLVSDIEIIGQSSNDKLPIYAFHIHKSQKVKSKKVKLWDYNFPGDLPKVLIIGQHHGEEPIGVEIALGLIADLVGNNDLEDLIKNYYFVIIPTVNPEAYKIVNSGQYPLKRKNNTDSNLNGVFDLKVDGVDLNKNYPSNWDIADLNDPECPYYKGNRASSEAEIQAVIKLGDKMDFDYAFFYHSSANGTYPEMIFFPYHWGLERSQEWNHMKSIADSLAMNLPCFYKDGHYHVHTGETSKYGYARDYFYKTYGTYAFTIEVSGITPNGIPLFMPKNNDLFTIIKKHRSALTNLLRIINP